MKEFPSFRGAVPETITPFKEDGSIDFDLLHGEIEHVIRNGVPAIFVNGLASEALNLTPDEHIEITKAVIKFVDGRVPIMGNICCNTLSDALYIVKGYETAGVSAICANQPSVYKISQDSLYDYFAKLLSSTELPFGIYNERQTGNILSAQTVARLFNDFPHCYYYKESTIDFIHVQTMLHLIGEDRPMELLSGSDASSYLLMTLGGVGAVSIISTVFTKPVAEMCSAFFAGDTKKAKQLQYFILDIRDTLKIGPFDAGYKYAAGLLGVPLGYMRKPLQELSEAQKGQIKDKLMKLGLV